MTVLVVLRVSCDAFGQKVGNLTKRCLENGEFEAPNIRDARLAAEDALWCFDTTGKRDKAYCPKHGPQMKPHLYSQRRILR